MSEPIKADRKVACSQCRKPAVVSIQGGHPLCIDCWYKLEVTKTLAIRLHAINMNLAAAQMDAVSGLPGLTPRMQVPDLPRGPMILNNIKVDNSVVGAINTGTVHNIDVNLTYLEAGGNAKAKEALKNLTEAVLADKSLGEAQKHELLDQIGFITEQSIAPAKDRKPGTLKAVLNSVKDTATTISTIGGAWQVAEPILHALFGIP